MNYQLGVGVEKSAKFAAHYFKRACDAGEARFCQLLQRFEQGATDP